MANKISIFGKKKFNDFEELELNRLLSDSAPFDVREAYLKLCTNISFIPSEKNCKTIAVTSAVSGEGKSISAANIAIGLSNYIGNNKVLLIDSDLRCPKMQRVFCDKDSNARGLSEYLTGSDEELTISKNPSYSSLDIVYAGATSPNPVSLLSSKKLKDVIEKLEQVYDYIIIDTPPINLVTDALLYSSFVDGYIISARVDYSNVNLINETVNTITDVSGKVLGVVLNSAKSKRQKNNACYTYGSVEDCASKN